MRWSPALLLLALVVLGCAHEEPPPPVPAPPEDLSTWSVPELVQPPADPTPAPREPAGEKPTPAEQMYTFTPGVAFAVKVPTNTPLDVVMERGEQVRNIVGGDRAPADSNQTARWEVKEGADGIGDTLRHHVFLTAATANLTTGGHHHDHETHVLPDV
jgi:hypothetical protein